jgi:hypothetical protein
MKLTSMFNFARHCPGHITIKTQAGVIIKEYVCKLPKDHQGAHRSDDGCIWQGNEKELQPK